MVAAALFARKTQRRSGEPRLRPFETRQQMGQLLLVRRVERGPGRARAGAGENAAAAQGLLAQGEADARLLLMPHHRKIGVEHVFGSLGVAGGNLFKNLMMLAIGKLHFATLHQAKTPEEVKFVEQPSIKGQKSSVAATLRQALVKTEVKSVVPIEIFSFRCVIHRFHQPL